ncbi:MAG: class I SAM-dependent methyltransferase [Deltaproteobacteria bacterium]|nr:class I SAM-dependent methyltransferase [Deltaproteobacteria bacterium]
MTTTPATNPAQATHPANAATDHWNTIYATKGADHVSWYRPHLDESLRRMQALALPAEAHLIDVGGGASTLVDDWLDLGFRNVHVVDLAATALDVAKARLGERSARVRWQVADICKADLPADTFDFWHDRAVFHFLRDLDQRAAYVAAVHRSVKVGGHVLVATFAAGGPTRCSGLEVVRYDADSLHREFGGGFERVDATQEVHHTPWGSEQAFVYCLCRVRG